MYASDISQEAVDLSVKNLSLLSSSGIASRKNELQDLFSTYHKESHKDALDSIDRLTKKLKHEVKSHVFVEDILRKDALHDETFTADVLITDVPYNNLVNWSSNNGNEINELLDAIIPVIDPNTIIAIVHNKKQKLNNPRYKVLEKLSVGHRKIEIIQLHG
jgi:cell fate (sporulation/competence/biofilm development) regulator YmcA (YheA/YmcA/DUF963 family)